ncbi:hypothetical protein D9M69_532300 [compost metagenome]
MDLPVEDIPEFRPLAFGIPLSELITNREDPFFRPCFFFVSPGAAYTGIETVLFYSIQQGDRLQGVTTGIFSFLLYHLTLVNAFLNISYDQPFTDIFYQPVTILYCFREIVPGVNMHQRERKFPRPKCLLCEMYQGNRVFPSGEQQRGFFKLSGYFPQNINGFCF